MQPLRDEQRINAEVSASIITGIADSGSGTTLVDGQITMSAGSITTANNIIITSQATGQKYISPITSISGSTFTFTTLGNSYAVVQGDSYVIKLL